METLKESKTILLRHEIIMYTDHKNSIYKSAVHVSSRVLRQRLIIEEYGADLKYIKGGNNCVIDTKVNTLDVHQMEIYLNRRVYKDNVPFPLDFKHIKQHQENDSQLTKVLKTSQRNKYYKIVPY